MIDLFGAPAKVYLSMKFDNFVIIKEATFHMLPTMEGATLRKLCVNIADAIKEYELIYIGEL